MNGRGTMMDSVGNSQRSARFHIFGSTDLLSNAAPPPGIPNMMGYSSAIFIMWCLQAPMGITETVELDCTVMARVQLQCHNPIPGFLRNQTPIFQTPPGLIPGEQPDWVFAVNIKTSGFEGDALMASTAWCLNHYGDAWLAGGYYFQFPNPHQQAPTEIYGVPEDGAVYRATPVFGEWETNNGWKAQPIYFASFTSPISKTVTLVGFTNYEWATNQASGWTGNVPAGAELCIQYHSPGPTWATFCPKTTTISDTTYYLIKFYKLYTTNPPGGGPIYSSAKPVASAPGASSGSYTAALPPARYTTAGTASPQVSYTQTRQIAALVSPPQGLYAPRLPQGPSVSTYQSTAQQAAGLPVPMPPWPQSSTTSTEPQRCSNITGQTLPTNSSRSSQSSQDSDDEWSDSSEWSTQHLQQETDRLMGQIDDLADRLWDLQAHTPVVPGQPGLFAQASLRMRQRHHQLIHGPYSNATAPTPPQTPPNTESHQAAPNQLPRWGSLLRRCLSAAHLPFNQ